MTISPRSLRPSITAVVFVLITMVCLFMSTPANAQVNVVVNGGSGTNAERQIVTINNDMRGLVRQLVEKEFNYDPAAHKLMVGAMRTYVNQQVQYLNHGQDGSSFYIKNLQVYKEEIRATTTASRIKSLADSSNVCASFKNEVVVALKESYVEENRRSLADKNSCVVDTAGDASGGEFFSGKKFDSKKLLLVGLNPTEQTPVGSFLTNQGEIDKQAQEAVDDALVEANWGDGFKSAYAGGQTIMACRQREVNGIGMPNGSNQVCVVATPAALMRERAANLSKIEWNLILNADELKEEQLPGFQPIITAALQRGLSGQAQVGTGGTGTGGTGTGGTGTGGTGTGGSTNPTDPNYQTPGGTQISQVTNNVADQTTRRFLVEVTTTIDESSASTTNPVRRVLNRVLTKLQYQLQTIELIDNAEKRHDDAAEDPEYQAINCYTLGFPNNFRNERTLTQTEIPFTVVAIKELFPLYVEFEKAIAQNKSTTELRAQFQHVLDTNFAIPTQVDLNGIADKYNQFLGGLITEYNQAHNEQVQACEAELNPPSNSDNSNNTVDTGGGG